LFRRRSLTRPTRSSAGYRRYTQSNLEIDQDDGRVWLFKEPESPPSPDEQDVAAEPPALVGFSDKQLHEIVDFDGLMQRLREIAADRPLKPVAPPLADRNWPHQAARRTASN
jgi:hypothetical protein